MRAVWRRAGGPSGRGKLSISSSRPEKECGPERARFCTGCPGCPQKTDTEVREDAEPDEWAQSSSFGGIQTR